VLFNDKRIALINGQIRVRIEHPIGAEQPAEVICNIGGVERRHKTCNSSG